MQRDTIVPLAIGVVVVAAVIAGLTVTGGPTTARAEKRDMARLADLRSLASFVNCVSGVSVGLPLNLKPVEDCGTDLPLADRTSQVPYRYARLSDTGYLLCADFERPELITDYEVAGATWRPSQGCFAFTQS